MDNSFFTKFLIWQVKDPTKNGKIRTKSIFLWVQKKYGGNAVRVMTMSGKHALTKEHRVEAAHSVQTKELAKIIILARFPKLAKDWHPTKNVIWDHKTS